MTSYSKCKGNHTVKPKVSTYSKCDSIENGFLIYIGDECSQDSCIAHFDVECKDTSVGIVELFRSVSFGSYLFKDIIIDVNKIIPAENATDIIVLNELNDRTIEYVLDNVRTAMKRVLDLDNLDDVDGASEAINNVARFFKCSVNYDSID